MEFQPGVPSKTIERDVNRSLSGHMKTVTESDAYFGVQGASRNTGPGEAPCLRPLVGTLEKQLFDVVLLRDDVHEPALLEHAD